MKKLLLLVLSVLVLAGCEPQEVKDKDSLFIPPLPQEPKLQYLMTLNSETDIMEDPSQFQQFVLGNQESMNSLQRPYAMGSSKGKIYITDRGYRKILIIDLANKKFDILKDRKRGTLVDPVGLWITPDGYKYVADMSRNQVISYGPNDDYIRAFGEKDQFVRTTDVAVYENKVYICDHKAHKVFIMDKDSGEVIKEIGEMGTEDGQFFRPSHLTVDSDGNLYVNDSFNFRVQMFDSEGTFIKNIGAPGDIIGHFARPKGIAVSRDKHLYAVDTAFENVQIFDVETAEVLLFFGGYETGAGSMYLPNGIHLDYDNIDFFQEFADKDFQLEYLVYVGNMLGEDKMNVYGFGKWIGEPISDTQPETEAPAE